MGRSHDIFTLFRLARLHWRAGFRKQFRRMRSPSGCLFGLLGFLLITGWLGLMVFGPGRGGGMDWGDGGQSEEVRMLLVQAFLAAFGFLSLMGAFNAKGLYLPKSELHALLSAPISTSDLVRYRLFVDGGKTALSGVIFVALFWNRLPSPGYGVFGILLALFAITILARMFSLALGNTNLWIGRFFVGRALGRVGFSVGMVIWAAMIGLLVMADTPGEIFGDDWSMDELFQAASESPAVIALLAPLRPFAELVVAETTGQFLTWLAVNVGVLVLLFELCARSAGEIREATLTTSEALAKRIGAMRKGHTGLAAMGRAERKAGARVRRLPRLFGYGRLGTIAWAQLLGITRFSLATTLIGFIVVGLAVVMSLEIDGDAKEQVMMSSLMITGLGTMYLAATMRFDFRSSLSRMESIKSWPIPSARLFFATVLPQVLLVTALLVVGVLTRTLAKGVFHPALVPCLLLIPAFVYAWVSLDNAVFLLFPVKFVPGQDGAVHHIGRSLLLLVLRLFLLSVAGGVLALIIFAMYGVTEALEMDSGVIESAVPWILFAGILFAGWCFTLAGGAALRRFDVSRQIS
ncbi:MAG: putative ABC exporter domain-containing protein [Planctomycetes bacterium]|nr:putative ABC exporter domain-containing protein [Planctomycetota bacterium]